VQLRAPVSKFPDFVRYIVQRLKVLCPTLGKVKIAQIPARAGLHLDVTTVGRMLRATPGQPRPGEAPAEQATENEATSAISGTTSLPRRLQVGHQVENGQGAPQRVPEEELDGEQMHADRALGAALCPGEMNEEPAYLVLGELIGGSVEVPGKVPDRIDVRLRSLPRRRFSTTRTSQVQILPR